MDPQPFLRVLVAALLTVPIGLDRELRGKAAGLRTHVVVATAAAALGYLSAAAAPPGVGDGTRIAAQVVSGIGFMGAGVIFASEGRVHGLTTAAALFSAAATGLCVGLGQFWLAVSLVVVTELFLWPVDRLLRRGLGGLTREERIFHVITPDLAALTQVQHALSALGMGAREVAIESFGNGVSARLTIGARRDDARRILSALTALEAVSFVADEAFTSSD